MPDDDVIDEGNPNLPVAFIGNKGRELTRDELTGGPSVESAANALRTRAALEARAHGFEYYQIGEQLGVTTKAAEMIVRRGLKATLREPADDVRKLELKRLDMLLQVYFDQAMSGHGPSVDRVLMMMERRARIEGIDAPLELDFASIRSQFFQRARDVLPPEMYVMMLHAFSEGKA